MATDVRMGMSSANGTMRLRWKSSEIVNLMNSHMASLLLEELSMGKPPHTDASTGADLARPRNDGESVIDDLCWSGNRRHGTHIAGEHAQMASHPFDEVVVRASGLIY